MIPRNPLRPRAFEVPTGANESPTFEVRLQDTELSRLNPGAAVGTVHLTIQSGTVSLVLATADAEFIEVPPAEIDYNAPTPVSRERVAEVLHFPMLDPSNSVTPRIPAPHLRGTAYVYLKKLCMTLGCHPPRWS